MDMRPHPGPGKLRFHRTSLGILLVLLASFPLLLLAACPGSNSTPAPIPTATPLATATPTAANAPTQKEPPRSVRLPEDEAGHDAPVEWWYFNGHLTDSAGRGYSFHFVTFQTTSSRGLTPRLLQLSWADHARRLHLAEERAGFQPAEVTAGRFDVQVSGWQMRGDGVNYGLVFNTGEYSLDLQAISSKPAAPHNQSGLITLGRAGASYYYSHTRLDTSGTLIMGGERRLVNGISWLDHQWGDFRVEQLGWDWVSLQLDDNSELMLYLLRNAADRAPIATYATFVAPDASVRGLDADDITLTATGSWTSPVSGAVYPMGWRLKVASLDLSVGLTPVQDDSEFAISAYVPAAYWEGAVSVMGSKGGSALAGKGFVELVGYDPGQPEVRQLPLRDPVSSGRFPSAQAVRPSNLRMAATIAPQLANRR